MSVREATPCAQRKGTRALDCDSFEYFPAAATAVETRPRVSLLPIFLIVLVDVVGMTLVLPLLAIYAETFQATPLQATLLVLTFAVCQLISGPLVGHWSDRIGRKPMLLISQVGTCIGFLVLARANALWMVYLSRVIDGSTAGNLSLAQAYTADHTRWPRGPRLDRRRHHLHPELIPRRPAIGLWRPGQCDGSRRAPGLQFLVVRCGRECLGPRLAGGGHAAPEHR